MILSINVIKGVKVISVNKTNKTIYFCCSCNFNSFYGINPRRGVTNDGHSHRGVSEIHISDNRSHTQRAKYTHLTALQIKPDIYEIASKMYKPLLYVDRRLSPQETLLSI